MKRPNKLTITLLSSLLAIITGLLLAFSGAWFSYVYTAEKANQLTIEQMSVPYWYNKTGNETIIYNEIVTPIRYDNSSEAVGFLTYTPTEIISVKNYSMEITYNQNQYTLSGNKISFPYNNGLPYLQDQWLDGKNIPLQYNDGSIIEVTYNDNGGTNEGKHVVCENAMTRTNFLVVTYKYNHTEQPLGFNTPTYSPQNFPNLLKKLNNAEPIKILVFGDSISVGASASSMMGFAPYTPTWFDQIKNFLANRYYGGDSSKITLVNASRGGVSSSWGVEQIENNKFDKNNYDLVFIGYGMNDGSLSHNATMFKNNISSILTELRKSSPKADFVIIGTFMANPKSIFAGNHSSYMPLLEQIANDFNFISENGYNNQSGCTFINMWDISQGILNKKQANNTNNDTRYQYMDISANYTNHPNDFMIRLYAGAILSAFVDFN